MTLPAGEDRPQQRAVFARVGEALALVILALGVFWAFQRGANDFSVFYEAWSLVWNGRAFQAYSATPDRFLYAPVFAFLFAPLAVLPKAAALAIWCAAKVAAAIWLMRRLGPLGGWAIVIVARPLLIDFQYGQVNLLILAAAVWALQARTPSSWLVLAFAGVAKLLALPLLIVPWIRPAPDPRRRLAERSATVLGFALALAFPWFFTEGWEEFRFLYSEWKAALFHRGLPMESHNQSFAAFLLHYFSGKPTHVVAQYASRQFSIVALPESWIQFLSGAWILGALAFLLGWLWKGGLRDPSRWMAISVGALILPSHLVWKPYFVFTAPLFASLAANTAGEPDRRRRRNRVLVCVGAFLAINFTSFDFVGYELAGRLEAASVLLWAHLVLLIAVVRLRPAY